MAKIISVTPRSVGAEVGIKKGDELLSFNGESIVDILDYYFYDQEERFTMTVKRKNKIVDIDIEKEEWESLGLELDDSTEITPIRCKNKCKFCFVDQLPRGMRDTLYVKDDDYRLSFISGNFVTLTNVGEAEMNRIIKLKLSPMYISVHATDAAVLADLVANPESRNTYGKMQRLSDAGIIMHAQIVMCQGYNDGKILKQSLQDLKAISGVRSVAVVPLGMTGHRDKLARLEPISKDTAIEAIRIIDGVNVGGQYVFASDEMYLRAGIDLPSHDYYGEYEQLENGVGLMRYFDNEVNEELTETADNPSKIGVTCITGVSFKDELVTQLNKIKSKLRGLEADVIAINNDFFGRSITVAGLIAAKDIISQASGKVKEKVIIPSTMLREFTDTFLDGMTVAELEKVLSVSIKVCNGGGELVRILASLGEEDSAWLSQ